MPKYSFIIPVYKTEKYLNQCIESLLGQSFADFEIILIDDESPDNCPLLCDEWALREERIRVIHQKNGGASAARNNGLSQALGRYVIFVDSDDYWLYANGLEQIDLLFTEGVDIVAFASMTLDDAAGVLHEDRYSYPALMNQLSPRDCLQYMIVHDLFNVHPGKRAFRKAFLLENKLFFQEGIRAEDIELYIRVSDCLPSYRFLDQKLYVYRQRADSVTSTVDGIHLSEHLGIIEKYLNYPFSDSEIRGWMRSYLAYSLSIVIAHTAFIKPDNAKELDKRIRKCCGLFRYTLYPRTRKIAIFYRIFGYHVTKMLLGLYLGRRLH